MLGGLVVCKVVEKNRSQDGALGFHIRGKHAQVVIRGRQFSVRSVFVGSDLQYTRDVRCGRKVFA
jgi:hypothetical protein